jgi:hypothetical protein
MAGILGALAQNAWVLETVVSPPHDIVGSLVSDLGARTMPGWWFYTAADVVAGIGTVLFAAAVIPLWRRLERRSRPAVLGAFCLLLSGAGTFADGLLREPCPETLSAACKARLDAGAGGWIQLAHEIESSFTPIVTVLAVVLIAYALTPDRRWGPAGRWMWILMPAFVVVNVVAGIATVLMTSWMGVPLRALQVVTAASTIPPTVRLWQLAPSERGRSVRGHGREPLEHPHGVERAP